MAIPLVDTVGHEAVPLVEAVGVAELERRHTHRYAAAVGLGLVVLGWLGAPRGQLVLNAAGLALSIAWNSQVFAHLV